MHERCNELLYSECRYCSAGVSAGLVPNDLGVGSQLWRSARGGLSMLLNYPAIHPTIGGSAKTLMAMTFGCGADGP